MPDPIFENPRLVAIYDVFDGTRQDLDHYVALARDFGARSVLDFGCGTGCLANRLAAEGMTVTGLDPAEASIEVAKRKPNADKVRWIAGDVAALPAGPFDLAVMTGNVAQVFVQDQDWERVLAGIRRVLAPQGHLVFEVRDPARQAWKNWTREKTYQRLFVPDIGWVEGWCQVTNDSHELVSFRWHYAFESDGALLTSDSTLRFRDRAAIEQALHRTGWTVRKVRDAPDRPGQEFVFVAVRAER